MSFSNHKIVGFTHKISDLPDQPNMQPEELKAHFDSSPEELRQALNALCDALAAQTAAADIGFAQTAGVPETTVQEAIENVQSQVTEAIIGSIPSGSITGDKLAQDVRDRFSAIESAAAGEASTRANADSSMQSQISALSTTKCEVYCGFYTGDGTENRTISLSKTPRAVLVMTNSGMMYTSSSHGTYGGLAVTGSPVIYQSDTQQAVSIVSNGFQVTHGGQYNCLMTNVSDTVYNYIAFF
ncbi:hypothetical protein [Agathobaculum sp.]|uniref:hypothetical protein n=1 Tax=Agathobaculum sp. TaxID=2048138 RepID=UPI0039A25659